jgi:transposase
MTGARYCWHIIAGESPRVPDAAIEMVGMLAALDTRLLEIDRRLGALQKSDEMAKRIATIPSIGPVGAPALAAAVTDPGQFRSGRQFAAWLAAGGCWGDVK